MSLRWYWVRHAPLTEGRGRLAGRRDVPADLSDVETLKQMRARLPANARWLVSPLLRTRQTAEALIDAMPEAPSIVLVEDLMEQAFGAWEGLRWDEIDAGAFWANPVNNAPPGGESFSQVLERVQAYIRAEEASQDRRDRVAICHAGPIRAARALAWGTAPEETTAIETPDYLSVSELSFQL